MSETQPDDRSIRSCVGTVKWFDPRKGFGFIIGPDGQDIFAHFTVIEGDGFRVLHDGGQVEYDADLTDRGWKATRVVERPPADDAARVHIVRRPDASANGVHPAESPRDAEC